MMTTSTGAQPPTHAPSQAQSDFQARAQSQAQHGYSYIGGDGKMLNWAGSGGLFGRGSWYHDTYGDEYPYLPALEYVPVSVVQTSDYTPYIFGIAALALLMMVNK